MRISTIREIEWRGFKKLADSNMKFDLSRNVEKQSDP
jgi:hypothetical protein